MRRLLVLLALPLVLVPGCAPDAKAHGNSTGSTPAPVPAPAAIKTYTYEVVKEYPHDTKAYTQGLVWIPGGFYESTGQYGESQLRKVNLADGKALKTVDVDEKYFAEGLALFDGKLFQLTWENQVGFIYDAATFKKVGEFSYGGQGWGLATDGRSLILSDGTHQVRFLDPKTFKVQRTIEVFIDNDPTMKLINLNELEFIKGEIWANVWQTDTIVRIDPKDGKLLGEIDMSGIYKEAIGDPDNVLNGIAYDDKGDRIFVTGKRWSKLFDIKVKPKD